MFSRLSPRNSAITFDVGTAGVRAFQATARGPRVTKRDSMQLALLPSQRAADSQPTSPDYSRLARLAGQGNFEGRDVALVLSPPDVRFCALNVPKKVLEQPESKIRETLAWEVAREMRAEAHQLEVRYWPMPPGHLQGMNVMAVALPIERALGWHDLFAAQRLRLRRIDASPCAVAHLVRRLYPPSAKDVWGVLDLGFRSAILTVVFGNTPVYIRTLNASSERWTQKLAEAFDVAPSVAEQIKCRHGIRLGTRGLRSTESDLPAASLQNAPDIPTVILNLLRDSINDLIHEINRCLAYVLQNFNDANVARLFLAGGGANLPGLAEYLALQFDMPVLPLTNVTPESTILPGESEVPALPPANAADRILEDAPVLPETAAVVGGALLDLETR